MEILNDIAHKIGFDWKLALTHLINFLIIYFLLVKFALPGIKKTISERNSKIEKGLKVFEESKQVLKNAEAEANDIKKSAAQQRSEILAKTETEISGILKDAQEESKVIINKASKIQEEAENKGKEISQKEILKRLPGILSTIAEKSFSGKLTAEVNNDFISKIIK